MKHSTLSSSHNSGNTHVGGRLNRWNNIEVIEPLQNEMIFYKGNLSPIKGRFMGGSFVELPNGEIDQFDEWRPIEAAFKNIATRHVEDGKTKVIARGLVKDGTFEGEYKLNRFTYGVSFKV